MKQQDSSEKLQQIILKANSEYKDTKELIKLLRTCLSWINKTQPLDDVTRIVIIEYINASILSIEQDIARRESINEASIVAMFTPDKIDDQPEYLNNI